MVFRLRKEKNVRYLPFSELSFLPPRVFLIFPETVSWKAYDDVLSASFLQVRLIFPPTIMQEGSGWWFLCRYYLDTDLHILPVPYTCEYCFLLFLILAMVNMSRCAPVCTCRVDQLTFLVVFSPVGEDFLHLPVAFRHVFSAIAIICIAARISRTPCFKECSMSFRPWCQG